MIITGNITVDNPGNIGSFFDQNGLPDRSDQARIYAQNIHRALGHHRDFIGRSTNIFPLFDDSSRR